MPHWRNGHSRRIACLLAAALTAAPLAAAETWQQGSDFVRLQTALGANLPTGTTGIISLVESATPSGATPPNAYYIDATVPEFSEGLDPAGQPLNLVDMSGGASNGVSGHAQNTVGQHFFGNTFSMAPGSNQVWIYETNNWLSNVLKYNSSSAPAAQDLKVQNHSWIGTLNSTTNDQSALRRFDYLIEEDDMTAVVGSNNNPNGMGGTPSPTFAHPNLLAHSYNAIVVGRNDSRHSRGMTNGIYGPGRYRPDIVVNQSTVSSGTATVSSAAALLRGVLGDTPGDRSETTKAILLAGATKQEFASFVEPSTGVANPWNHTPTRPLDDVFGAGELNIYNSYLMTLGGQHAGSQGEPGAAVANSGWDYQDFEGDPLVGDLYYNFTVASGSTAPELSAILAWNVEVVDTDPSASFSPSESLQDLDLRLYDSTAGFLGTLLEESVSDVDNVEHIYRQNLGPGVYTLAVSGAADWDYGLAWRMSTLFDQPSADFDEDGLVSGADFLTWQRNYNTLLGASHGDGDADGDGDVDQQDLAVFAATAGTTVPLPAGSAAAMASESRWSVSLGAVPEPSGLALAGAGLLLAALQRGRSGRRTGTSSDRS